MKKLILILLFIPLVSFSQTKKGIEICLAVQQYSKSFISDKEAENALDKILSVIGASKNFTLQPCDEINNALAITYKGDRYILYDKKFMQLITQYSNSWSNMFILAHEVGHHINGHTRDAALDVSLIDKTTLLNQRTEELEADKFAGFVLAKLGATLNQTISAVNLISPTGDDRYSTHPNKEKRISAIKIGYNNGVGQKSREIKNPVYKKPISRSSKWIKTKNDSENPFETKYPSAYTIGQVKPDDANSLSRKPKLTVFRTYDSYEDWGYIRFDDLELTLDRKYKSGDGNRNFIKSAIDYINNNRFPKNKIINTDYFRAIVGGAEFKIEFEILFDNGKIFILNSSAGLSSERPNITNVQGNFKKDNGIIKSFIISEEMWIEREGDRNAPDYMRFEYNTDNFKELVTEIKNGKKMFFKINKLEIENTEVVYFKKGIICDDCEFNNTMKGHPKYDPNVVKVNISSDWILKNFNFNSYFEFDLTGSSKALDFID